MENSSEELFGFLNDSGKLASLRKYLICFLLSVDELRGDIDTHEDRGCEETGSLIQKIESHLHQLAQYQQTADQMLIEMKKEQRQALFQEAPEVLKLFGWHDRINEAGEIVRKT